MKTLAAILLVVVGMWSQTGCSVAMALSGEKDPNLSVLRAGESRGAVEMQLTKTLRERMGEDGHSYVIYEYTLGNSPSTGRAIAHGVMDVLTLGLWEVAGTPIEGVAGAREVHQVTVVYDADDIVVAVNPTGPAR